MRRFHRTILFSTLLWVASVGALSYNSLFHPILKGDSSKLTRYRASKSSKIPTEIFQLRDKVAKDLWLSSKEGRVHLHLESPSSTLQFNDSLIETLSGLKIWIKEAGGDVRYLRAESGEYNYKMHKLTSHEAFLSAYKINDPKSTLFSCIAKDLVLSFDKVPFSFTASGFSAHLQSQGGL